jgi:hypothetical protein
MTGVKLGMYFLHLTFSAAESPRSGSGHPVAWVL